MLAVDVLGHIVPTVVDGKSLHDAVMEVIPLGERMVQKITCENKFFLAGKTKGRYLLHHNVKPTKRGVSAPARGPIASYNMMPNTAGLKWGW